MKKIPINLILKIPASPKDKKFIEAVKQVGYSSLASYIERELKKNKLVKINKRTKGDFTKIKFSCVLCIDKPAVSKSRIK